MTAVTTVAICKQLTVKIFWRAIGVRQAALIARKLFYIFLVALQDTNSKRFGILWIK